MVTTIQEELLALHSSLAVVEIKINEAKVDTTFDISTKIMDMVRILYLKIHIFLSL